ncbi:topoisomerase IV [Burkholderia ubonensis]|uniref:Topoisomerase IV n=1 Tax=Burkholderia ubonensis TaxID=101571 RepID=A0A1B4LGL1_9BURK|nr:topoisomerase IV [Burkholderia ubonensis]AOJ76296.1 topoisomerase IV [Burkholderia ubonensis]
MTVPSPKSRLQLFAAALALLSALCAVAPAYAYADAPAALERGLHAFIRDTYGAWRADRKGWQPAAGDSIYSARGTLRVATADGPRMLLAMCGETDAAVANGMPGMGSDGTPGTVRIERLGPHLFGFVIGDGTTLQGYTQTSQSIRLPYRNALVEAAPRINEALDNGGSLDCANAKSHCERRTFAIAPDTTATDDVYPLTVIETGRRGSREIHARYTVKFDAARGRYVVPKALQEGY